MESERYERVMAAMRREVPDKVPWGLWGHMPALPFLKYYSWEKATRDGEESARAHLAILNQLDYKMDVLKVTPFFRFMAHQWGAKYRFINNNEKWENVELVVNKTEDWEKLGVLDPKKELKEYVRTISILFREIGKTMPLIITLPSPLLVAVNQLATPERAYSDMKSYPTALKKGLETITQSFIDYGRACIDEGASGIFYGVGSGGNTWSRMNRQQLEEYELYYDKKVLEALDAPIKILHICSRVENKEDPERSGGLMETGWFKQYPVHAINWWDANFTPISVGKKIYGDKFCIVGGVDHATVLRKGTPKSVEDQVKAAIESTGQEGGFMIGPGCTFSQDTPLENMNAVGRAVEKYGRYKH